MPGEETVLRAIYPPHWEEEAGKATLDLFARQEEVSVSRTLISTLPEIATALREELKSGTELKGFIEVRVETILEIVKYPERRAPNGKVPKDTPKELIGRVIEDPTPRNPAHAVLQVSKERDFSVLGRLTGFYSKQIMAEGNFVCLPDEG